MRGVDKNDQLRSYHGFFRKTKKWWKKLFFYLIEMNLSNSYAIHKKLIKMQSKIPLSFKDFRMVVVEYLLIDNTKYQVAKSYIPQLDHTKGLHLIENIGKQRVCVYKDCSSRSIYQCDTCKKSLCTDHFKSFHKNT